MFTVSPRAVKSSRGGPRRATVRRRGRVRLMRGNVGFHGQPGHQGAAAADAVEIRYADPARASAAGLRRSTRRKLIARSPTQGIATRRLGAAGEAVRSRCTRTAWARAHGEHIDPEDGLEHIFELHDRRAALSRRHRRRSARRNCLATVPTAALSGSEHIDAQRRRGRIFPDRRFENLDDAGA